MPAILSLVAAVALTVYGQLVIKARSLVHAAETSESASKLHYLYAMFTDFGVVSGLGAAVLAGAFWMLAIERSEIGYAYPFMALSFVLVPVGSMALFGEALPPTRMVGLGLIVAGVVLSAIAR